MNDAEQIVSQLIEGDELPVSYRETTPDELESAGVVSDFGDNAWGDCAAHGDPYLILLGDKPVGWMQITADNELNVIEVKPEFQRRGIGAEAIRQAFGGAPSISSPVSKAGAALLGKFGMKDLEVYESEDDWKELMPEPQAVQDLAKLKKYRPYIHHEYDHYYAPFIVPVWTPTGRLAKSKCWHGWYRMEGFTYANPPTWEQEVEAVGKLFPNRLPGFHPSRLQRLVRQGYRIGKPYDPYRERFYESIDEALNPEVCAQCKGKCCAFYPGMTSPEDWGAPDQDLMRERITQAVASGKYDFDSWYGDPTGKSEDDADVWMVRPASERQSLHQLDTRGYERCRMMGDKGCELAYSQRPRQCRELDPKEGGQGCGDQYSKKQAAIDWMPYQQLLHQIIYGTNESEDDFDAKDLTPLSAQEIELAAATEIADRLHQAGLKFVVKGDLATRAAAWPDLYKLIALGQDAQFVLDQRLKNATTGQDYVRFWTIIPYTPDYGDYYTTWQFHLQDVVGKEHKLWLHNRGLVEINIDVGESTQKEMVERLMVRIQEAKPIDRERLEKVYNKLYGQAADALSKRKPCAIDASTGRVTCLGSREGIYGNPTATAKYGGGAEMDTLCCTGCTHHTPQGCAAEKPLACKTWLCPHAAVKNPELAKRLRDLQSRAMKAKVYEPRGDMPTAISRGLRSWQWAKEEPRVLRPDYEEPGDPWDDQEKWAEAERLFGPEPQEYLAYQDWLDRVEEWWYSGLRESRLQVIENVGRVVGPIQEVRLVRWAATKHVPTGKIGKDFTHWDATEQLLKQGVIPGVNSLHDLDGMEDQNQATAFLQQLEDGYILDDGRFVTRDEGEQVAREMGQLRGAETEKVEREAIDADDIDMDMDIEEAQGTPEPDYDAVARYAHAWFKKNARNFNDWPYEIGFALYWSPQGKVVPGTLVQGEAAEVQWPEQPELGIEIGSIHSHTGCSAELSDFDAEEGQKVANRTGQFYAMFVIGPGDEGEGVTMVEEVFEPNVNESVDDECDWKELVPDHLGHIKFMCPFTLVQREGQPLVKHYFSDEVGDWIEEFDQATIYQINDYAKNGVIDLNDCPMGTEAIINVTPDGQFLQEIPLDGACGWKIVDSYVPESTDPDEDFDIKDVTGAPVAYKVTYIVRKGRQYRQCAITLTASTEEEALSRFETFDWPDARSRRPVTVTPVYNFQEAVDGDDVDMKEIMPDPRIFTLHWHGFDGQWYHTKPLPSLERALKLAFEWSLFTIKGDEAYIEEQHPEDPYNFITRHHLNDNYEVSNEEEGSSGRWFGVGEEPPLEEGAVSPTDQELNAMLEHIGAKIKEVNAELGAYPFIAPDASPDARSAGYQKALQWQDRWGRSLEAKSDDRIQFKYQPMTPVSGSYSSKTKRVRIIFGDSLSTMPPAKQLEAVRRTVAHEMTHGSQFKSVGGAAVRPGNLRGHWNRGINQDDASAYRRDMLGYLTSPAEVMARAYAVVKSLSVSMSKEEILRELQGKGAALDYGASNMMGLLGNNEAKAKARQLFMKYAYAYAQRLSESGGEDFDAKELTTPEDVLPIFQFTFEDDTREHGPRIEQVPVPWAVLQRHAGDWATLNKKEAAYMPLDDPCDYALPYVRKLHPDWPWGQLNDIRIVNKVEESEDDFDMKELTPESVRPVGFQLTFDFGAGEDGYSIQVFVPLEEFAPRFQTRDQIVAQWDEDMSMIEDTVIEYAQRTRTDIDRDDWSFMVGVDLLPAEERQRGHMIMVQNGDDPVVRCSVCGHQGNLMSDFSYLKAGFNGIQPGGADDLDLQECGACGAYLAWSNIRNVNESEGEDFDAKELDMPVFNPQLIVDEMKTNGWVQVSCTLSHPADQVWLLEWNSPLELTHDMPEDQYNHEADRAEAAGQAAVLGAYPQATQFEFLAPFTDGDFGLYFHIPGEYRATHTGYVTIGYQVMKLFSQWGITLRGIGKLDFEAQSVNLSNLLQSDPDFAAFVQAHPDIQPPTSPNLPTVVVDGKIISGYERPASRLKKGETDVWGYVSPVGTGKHQVAEAKIIATAVRYRGKVFTGPSHFQAFEALLNAGLVPGAEDLEDFEALPQEVQTAFAAESDWGYLSDQNQFVPGELGKGIGGTVQEKREQETRTYQITARPDHLDKIEQFFHWINTTRGGHSGSAMLGIDGDGAARVEVEKEDGDLAKPDEEIKSRCDGKAEFEVYLECQGCGHKFDYASVPESSMGAVHCPACASTVDQTGKLLEDEEDFDTKEVSNVELPPVPAYIEADRNEENNPVFHDEDIRVDFNAAGWFLTASYEQIKALAHSGWCRDYPADDVARDLAQDNHDLANFFETVQWGFEVYVNQEAAEAFLKQFRSDVYQRLVAEHEILESNTRGLPPPVEAEVREIHGLLQQSAEALRALDDRASLDERDAAVESLGQCAERLDNLDLNYAIQDFPALDWVLDAIRGARNDLLDLLNQDDWAKAEDADVVQRLADAMADLLK